MKEQKQLTNEADFKAWLKDPVTLAVFEQLSEVDEYYKQTLQNGDVLLGDQLQIAKFVGIREGLNQLLDIQIETSQEEQE